VNSGQFVVQHLRGFARRDKQETIEPCKFTPDRLPLDEFLDGVDGRGVTRRGQTCTVLAVQAFNFEIAIVEGIRQVGRGP
jgi:hypothetical protein